MFEASFWNTTRIAGLILVLGSLLPFIPSLIVLIWGDIKAAEAMFRDINKAVGQSWSLRVISVSWAAWVLIPLGGFALLGTALWEKGAHVLPVLSVIAFAVFATSVALEASFHFGVTSWAVEEIETGVELPPIFYQLKRWLNFYMEIIFNPLATLSFIGFGIALLRTHTLSPTSCWIFIVWGTLITFFPLPLLIAPVPALLGIALLLGSST